MNVLELYQFFMLVGCLDVASDLILHYFTSMLAGVRAKTDYVHLLQHFQTTSMVPMALESVHFVTLVPGGHCELLTPEGSKAEFARGILGVSPSVLDNLLVEKSSVEGPNMILIHSVVNSGSSTRRRIRVYGLSLNIIEFKLLVGVFTRNDRSYTHNVILVRFELLESLVLVSLMHWVVINITQERRVVFETLMPS